MSLINDVLRDLDARRRGGKQEASPALEGLDPALSPKDRPLARLPRARWRIALLIITGLLIGILARGWPNGPNVEARKPESSLRRPEETAASGASIGRRIVTRSAAFPEPRAGALRKTLPPSPVAAAREAAGSGGPLAGGGSLPRERAEETRGPRGPALAPAAATALAAENAPQASPAPQTLASSSPRGLERHARPATPGQLAQRAYREALRLIDQAEFEQARERLMDALELTPSHRRARLVLATLLAQHGELSEARRLLETGLSRSPGYAPFATLQARILAEANEVGAAVALLERAVPSGREDPDAHALLAALYQRQGRHGRAARLYRDVLRLEPQRAAWWMGLGISLEALREPSQALAAYQAARALGGLGPAPRNYVEERIEALRQGPG